jgi:hypothetical protein
MGRLAWSQVRFRPARALAPMAPVAPMAPMAGPVAHRLGGHLRKGPE